MKVTIVGRGLAGAWLTHELIARGVDVSIIDDGNAYSASRVSAGLINPTTGARPKSAWRSNTLLPFVRSAYSSLEASTGVKCYSERTLRRIFRTPDDERLWRVGVERGIGVKWTPIPPGTVEGVPMPYGGVEYLAAVVDTPAALTALEVLDGITVEQRNVDEIDVGANDAVVWCTGWHAAQHTLWSWLPFQPAKGEIITAQIGEPYLTSVYMRGIWIIPTNEVPPKSGMQTVVIGSNHDWDNLDTVVTTEARESLVEQASILLDRDMVVTSQKAGVRPAVSTKRPVMGRHPKYPEHVILNGLGTKGSVWAPWAAEQLTSHLVDGIVMDPEVTIQRWWHEDV